MATANVTIKFVNQPKEGKKFGSINTEEMGFFGVKPGDLGQFTKGQKYEIEYTQRGEYKDFVRVISPTSGAPIGHNRPNGNGGDAKSREMFIMGVVGRAMGSGKFGIDEVGLLTAKAAAAWDDHGTPKKDESPY
jgi:hypothetical protein